MPAEPGEIVVELASGEHIIYTREHNFGVYEGGYLEITKPGKLIAAFSPIGWRAAFREPEP